VRGVTAWNTADVANRYFERDILVVDTASLSEVTIQRPGVPPITFRKEPMGVWTLDGLPADQKLDQAETFTFVNKLTNLRMSDPAAPQAKPEMGLDGPEATVVRWTGESEGQSTSGSYRIGAPIPGKLNRYYVQVEGQTWVMEVLKANLEQALVKETRTLLDDGVGPPTDLPPPPHGGGGGPHGGGGSPHGGKAPGHP
jgi:hypothetical protein